VKVIEFPTPQPYLQSPPAAISRLESLESCSILLKRQSEIISGLKRKLSGSSERPTVSGLIEKVGVERERRADRSRWIVEAKSRCADWHASPAGLCVDVSDEICTELGWPARRILGGGFAGILHPDDGAIDAWLTSVRTGRPFVARYRIRRSDRRWAWVRGVAYPLDHGWAGTLEML
jgi:PAS domain-containing protein